jgi:hypothetical protein
MTDLSKMSIPELKKLEEVSRRNFSDIQNTIRFLENEERSRKLEPLKNLVIRAHDILCGWNHTDGCGWHYEIDDKGQHIWTGYAHARWLSHYEQLTNGEKSKGISFSVEEITSMLDVLEELRKKHPKSMFILRFGSLIC